jgi:hypothetical protein
MSVTQTIIFKEFYILYAWLMQRISFWDFLAMFYWLQETAYGPVCSLDRIYTNVYQAWDLTANFLGLGW